MKHVVTRDLTVPVIVEQEEAVLPESLADRLERVAREWDYARHPYSLQTELLKIADEVREQMGELAILQRPKRTAMASWRRMIRAIKG